MKLGAVVWIERGLEPAAPGAHYPNLRAETLPDELAWARDFGFTGLQIGWRGPAPMEPAEIVKTFAQERVEIVAGSAYTDFLGAQHNWPCKDLAAVKDMIAATAALGADVAVTWGGFGDHNDEHNQQVVADALAQAAECAQQHGVKLALELYDQCVFGTVESITTLADELSTDAIGVMMDPPNTMKASDVADLPGYYARLMQITGKRLFAAHAKGVAFEDDQRKLPGPHEGVQDYVAYIRALAAAGFDGHLLVEHVTRDTVAPARDFVAAKIEEALG